MGKLKKLVLLLVALVVVYFVIATIGIRFDLGYEQIKSMYEKYGLELDSSYVRSIESAKKLLQELNRMESSLNLEPELQDVTALKIYLNSQKNLVEAGIAIEKMQQVLVPLEYHLPDCSENGEIAVAQGYLDDAKEKISNASQGMKELADNYPSYAATVGIEDWESAVLILNGMQQNLQRTSSNLQLFCE